MLKRIALIFFFFIVALSCADLDVENLNKPDSDDILTHEFITNYASDLHRLWFNRTQGFISPALNLAVHADQLTCSWSSWWYFGMEPREQWNNKETYKYEWVTRYIWETLYDVFNVGTDILQFLSSEKGNEMEESEKKMLTAWSNFNMGISLGYIALIFDRGFINTDDAGSFSPGLAPWYELIPVSIQYLDECIEICNDYSFELPDNYIAGTNYTSKELAKLSNTFAARIIAYSPRNATQNDTLDWARVLQYATNGIDFNYEVGQLDDPFWGDYYIRFCIRNNWFRIDHRIINLLDPGYPHHFPSENIWPEDISKEATSSDARLLSDFRYWSSYWSIACPFRPERGYYHWSYYSYDRYSYMWAGGGFQGDIPLILKWENDLLIAEALIRANNDLAGAIAILNDPEGPRKTRGGLEDIPIGSGIEDILDAIFYERDIELLATGMGVPFFDMRRRDMLQTGSLLHFPVPGGDLNILGIDYYTFGGEENADGINTSNGGWF